MGPTFLTFPFTCVPSDIYLQQPGPLLPEHWWQGSPCGFGKRRFVSFYNIFDNWVTWGCCSLEQCSGVQRLDWGYSSCVCIESELPILILVSSNDLLKTFHSSFWPSHEFSLSWSFGRFYRMILRLWSFLREWIQVKISISSPTPHGYSKWSSSNKQPDCKTCLKACRLACKTIRT